MTEEYSDEENEENMKLIKEMETYLPIPVYPSKELQQLLRKQGKDIGRDTELNITNVFDSYHLLTLEEYGFVSSKYEISEYPKSRGKAIRKYWVNGKVEEVISELRERL